MNSVTTILPIAIPSSIVGWFESAHRPEGQQPHHLIDGVRLVKIIAPAVRVPMIESPVVPPTRPVR
jgi:hypothetical protein